MISIALNDVFKNAVAYAKENRHEYLTVEHLFLCIVRSGRRDTCAFKCRSEYFGKWHREPYRKNDPFTSGGCRTI